MCTATKALENQRQSEVRENRAPPTESSSDNAIGGLNLVKGLFIAFLRVLAEQRSAVTC